MSTISQQPTSVAAERRHREGSVVGREMWAALAIAVIWIAVLFTSVYGADIVTVNAGASNSTVPSVVVVALFASPATWAIAKYGFGRRGNDSG